MKITRNFAPITLVIEYECELESFRNILDLALKEARSRRSVFQSSMTDAEQHILHLRQKI